MHEKYFELAIIQPFHGHFTHLRAIPPKCRPQAAAVGPCPAPLHHARLWTRVLLRQMFPRQNFPAVDFKHRYASPNSRPVSYIKGSLTTFSPEAEEWAQLRLMEPTPQARMLMSTLFGSEAVLTWRAWIACCMKDDTTLRELEAERPLVSGWRPNISFYLFQLKF